MGGFARAILRPACVFLMAAVIVGLLIVGIGTALLRAHPDVIVSEFTRPDLLIVLGLALLILVAGAFLSRPRGEPHKLDQAVAIGEKPFFTPVTPPPTDEAATIRGPQGTWADVQPGFTLYAMNGPLAKVVTTLPPEEEFGKLRRGLVYASGLYGANEEMWIPFEAIYAVYPETSSAFLAVKGDEIENFGWDLPPESFRRGPGAHKPISSF